MKIVVKSLIVMEVEDDDEAEEVVSGISDSMRLGIPSLCERLDVPEAEFAQIFSYLGSSYEVLA